VQRKKSEECLRQSNQNKADCFCCYGFQHNQELITLIERFLEHIKNMLFLDANTSLEQYCLKFERVLKEKKIDSSRYVYIRQLIQYKILQNGQQLNKTSFVMMVKQLLSTHDLCQHDIDPMLLILESFKDMNYIELFLFYLD
jgi:hypothetical protein